ncbi:PucR family transcriptional regulator [Monashia sp. NPDC004114]
MDATTTEKMGAIARDLLPRTDQIADEVTEHLLREVPQLTPNSSGEEVELVQQSTRQNTGAFLATLGFGITASSMEPPHATVELLNAILRAGGSATDLMRGYRVGHDQVWRLWSAEVRSRCEPAEALEILEASSAHLFTFVDRACIEVLAHAKASPSDTDRNSPTEPEATPLAFSGKYADPVRESHSLGHAINDVHVAIVGIPLWPATSARPELQRVIRAAGAAAALVTSGEDGAWSAWLRWMGNPTAEALDRIASMTVDGVLIGMGEPLRGQEGFVRSHEQAAAALALGRLADDLVATIIRHRDVELAALLCADPSSATHLCEDRLGTLLDRDDTSARLRATVRSVLRHGQNRAKAAAELHIHHKTVAYRIAQAEERLGRSLASDTVAIEAALIIDEVLHPHVDAVDRGRAQVRGRD